MTGRLRLVAAARDSARDSAASGVASPPSSSSVSTWVTPERPLLREVVGARLRRARAAQGRSLRDVADAAGVSTGHLSQVERGLAEASSEVLRAVCRALGLPLSALLRAASADLAVLDLAAPSASAPAAPDTATASTSTSPGVLASAA